LPSDNAILTTGRTGSAGPNLTSTGTSERPEENPMETWGEGNFDNQGAKDYLNVLAARLVAAIKEVVADDERIQPDEDGETILMPSVELLALLCERYNVAPPKEKTIRQWGQQYLQVFDEAPDNCDRDSESKAKRRRMIERTFRWLEGLAESYYT
jgi:hypothetical protein